MDLFNMQIQQFSCDKQKVEEVIHSFVEIGENYFRYSLNAYICQYNEEAGMINQDAKYICDDDIFLLKSFSGVYMTTAESDDGIYIIKVFFYDTCVWMRFKKESEARFLMNKILEWSDIKISK